MVAKDYSPRAQSPGRRDGREEAPHTLCIELRGPATACTFEKGMHIETIQDVAAIFQKLLVEFIGLIFQINSLRFWLPRTRARVRWEHAERQKLQAQCNAMQCNL